MRNAFCFALLSASIFFAFLNSTSAEEIFSKKSGSFSIQLSTDGQDAQLSIVGPGLNESKSFSLTSPARVVIDFPSNKESWNGTFSLPTNFVATKIRIGTTAGKIRVVLDSPKADSPKFTKTVSEKSLRLSFGNGLAATSDKTPAEVKPTAVTPLPTPVPTVTAAPPQPTVAQLTPVPTPVPQVTAATATAIPQASATVSATIATTPGTKTPSSVSALPVIPPPVTPVFVDPEEIHSEPVEDTALKLEKIEFVSQDAKAQAAEIVLSAKTSYDLTKRDDRSFVLTIPGVKTLLPQLTLPYFAPQSATGFTVISARITAQGLEVLVGVTPGVKIVSFPKGNTIVLRAAVDQ